MTGAPSLDWRGNALYFIAAILLMPINWSLESIKWQTILSNNTKVSFQQAFKAVWSGMSIAIFTPNRVGEFAGRAIYLRHIDRRQVILSTIMGNYAQMLIIICLGLCGFTVFSQKVISLNTFYIHLVYVMNALFILLIGIVYYHSHLVLSVLFRLIPSVKWRKRFVSWILPLKSYRRITLTRALFLSTLRYLVYTFQYYLTLCFFNVKLPFLETLSSIATVYLFKTSIPYPPALGILMRGEISLWVFKFYTIELVKVLAASMMIWLMNVVLPAVLGYIFLIKKTRNDGL